MAVKVKSKCVFGSSSSSSRPRTPTAKYARALLGRPWACCAHRSRDVLRLILWQQVRGTRFHPTIYFFRQPLWHSRSVAHTITCARTSRFPLGPDSKYTRNSMHAYAKMPRLRVSVCSTVECRRHMKSPKWLKWRHALSIYTQYYRKYSQSTLLEKIQNTKIIIFWSSDDFLRFFLYQL